MRPASMAGLLLLGGCGGDELEDLRQYVNEVKARPKGAVEAVPDIRVVEPFVFQASTIRDPFEPDDSLLEPAEVRVETGIRPDIQRPREELEGFDLDALRMVGTVRQPGTVWALIQARDGTIHRVRAGNYIGKNYGKIVTIQDNRIELVEIVTDSAGAWHERRTVISMAEAPDKAP